MLSLRVQRVCPLDGYRLHVEFEDGMACTFDVRPYLDRGLFRGLRDEAAFRAVRVAYGGIEWEGGQSLSADTLYLRGTPVGSSREDLGQTERA